MVFSLARFYRYSPIDKRAFTANDMATSKLTKWLFAAIALLVIDSILEVALLSTTVAWLHARAGQGFMLQGGPDGTFLLRLSL